MDVVWDSCRWANQYVAILAAIGVAYRLSAMALDRPRWGDERARHLLAWFTYIALGLVVSALAAGYYTGGPTSANWTSGARLGLNVGAICLSIWWPHPARYLPVEHRKP